MLFIHNSGFSQTANDYFKIAKIKMDNDNLKDAYTLFTKAIENNYIELYDAYYYRGIILLKIKSYDAALTEFNKSIEIKPDWSWGYYGKGKTIYTKTQNIPGNEISKEQYIENYLQSISEFDKAIEYKDKGAVEWFYFYRGKSYDWLSYHYSLTNKSLWKEYKNKAIDDFTNAINIDNKWGEAYFERGCCFVDLEEKEKACEDFYISAFKYKVSNAIGFYNKNCNGNNDQNGEIVYVSECEANVHKTLNCNIVLYGSCGKDNYRKTTLNEAISLGYLFRCPNCYK